MKIRTHSWASIIPMGVCLLAFAGGANAQSKKSKEATKVEARLIVEDRADLFSREAISKAKSIIAEAKDSHAREASIVSFKELPEAKKKQFEKLETAPEKKRFFTDWAKEEARDAKAKGMFMLISRKPGHVEVIVDKALRDKGVSTRDEELLVKTLIDRFKEAAVKPVDEQTNIRDKGLIEAAEFVRDAYKKIAR